MDTLLTEIIRFSGVCEGIPACQAGAQLTSSILARWADLKTIVAWLALAGGAKRFLAGLECFFSIPPAALPWDQQKLLFSPADMRPLPPPQPAPEPQQQM